jgi:carbamoyltransferase
MGLASWSSKHTLDAESWVFGSDSRPNLGRDFYHKYKIMQGNPFVEGDFSINWDVLEGLPDAGEFKADTFGRSAVIASSVQNDLEKCSLDLISSLKAQTLESNLALAGGVALNSVMNGRIMKESGFDQVFIPPAPGDEGVAVGCAMYGLQRYREEHEFETAEGSLKGATLIKRLVFSAYQGADFSDQEIAEAVSDYSGWVRVQRFSADSDGLVEDASDVLADGGVIAWFQGRSEFGQRALGSRSILSDPRTEAIRRVVNDKVKEREWWRPLAPSVLEESAREWFDLTACDASPYMSVTSQVKEEHRDKVPAVCHIDGTARLQVSDAMDEALT